MNRYKNLLMGVYFALFGLFMLTVFPQSASALIPPASWEGANYTLVNPNTIEIELANNPIVRFQFQPGPGGNRIYKPNNPVAQGFCNNDSYISISGYDASSVTLSGAIYAYYTAPAGNPVPCLQWGTNSNPEPIQLINRAAQFTGSITFENTPYTAIGATPTPYYGSGISTGPGNCYNGSVIVLDAPGARTGTVYKVQRGGPTPLGLLRSRPGLAANFPNAQDCWLLDLGRPISFGPDGIAAALTPVTEAGGSKSCEANSDFGLEWLVCPVLRMIDKAAGGFNKFISDQLCFRTNPTGTPSSTGGVVCSGENNLTNEVKVAWGIIKNVATGLLVVAMLGVVIAQATGWGGVEAYTLRKMMPKLVIAVILMQLSWVLLKWAIDLSNDAGVGIRNLLLAPFGGVDGTSLDRLIGQAGREAGITTGPEANTFLLFGVIAGGLLALANLPGLLLLGFYVLLALFIGFLVLVLRKMLIILLVILAPIALIAWILPNTESYWKFWRVNFTKLLIMFPLIMAMIAAGRIFGWVTVGGTGSSSFSPNIAVVHLGPLPVPYMADVTSFAQLAIVIFAYFAPFFLIPKAFSWGGGLMGSVANAVQNNRAMKNLNTKGSEAVGGYAERWQGKRAKAYDPNARIWTRGFRRLQSGHYLPTERSRRLTTASGDKWANERNDEASSLVSRSYEKALKGYDRLMVDEDGNYIRGIKRNAEGKMLDVHGNVTNFKKHAAVDYRGKDKAEAEVEHLTGVEAGKQALVDITGREGKDHDNRAAQAAHKLLLDTHSEIELQGSRIQSGKHAGKRVTEVPTWRSTLESSPPHYGAASDRRPDQAPDVIEGAMDELGYTYDQAYDENFARSRNTTTQELVKNLDKERLSTALKRMTPDGLQKAHYGLFQDIARMEDDGLSEQFRKVLVKFTEKGGYPGQTAVGSLRGGKEEFVERALAQSGASLDNLGTAESAPSAPPPATTTAPTTATPPTPTAPSPRTGGGGTPGRPSGSGWSSGPELPPDVLSIPHDDQPPGNNPTPTS